MRIIVRGQGTPVVVVPGIQGRWEWMEPAVDALARRCRVLTYSLADEPSCGARFDPARGFWCYVDQVREALDRAGVERAAVCGVSYGGLVAAAFAARHPERVSALILVSAIPPSWTPDGRVALYLRAPRLLTPVFMAASLRLYREIRTAIGGWRAAVFGIRHAVQVLSHMFSPALMARRVRMISSLNLREELATMPAPTLVVTGEPGLDRVVPVHRTHEYLRLWPEARSVVIERTGHLGLITRADAFARLVAGFAGSAERERAARRRIG